MSIHTELKITLSCDESVLQYSMHCRSMDVSLLLSADPSLLHSPILPSLMQSCTPSLSGCFHRLILCMGVIPLHHPASLVCYFLADRIPSNHPSVHLPSLSPSVDSSIFSSDILPNPSSVRSSVFACFHPSILPSFPLYTYAMA